MPPVQHFVLFCVLACVTISLAAGCNSDDSPAGDAVAESTTTAPETDGETSDAAREPEAAAAAARTTDPQATVDPEDVVSFDADPFVDPAPTAAAAGETPFAEPASEPAAEPFAEPVAAAPAVTTPAAPESAGYQLQHHFKAGQIQRFQMQTEVDQDANGVQMDIDIKSFFQWKVDEVLEDGSARLTYSCNRVIYKIKSPVGRINFDSAEEDEPESPLWAQLKMEVAATLGMAYTCTVSPRGLVSEITVPEEVVSLVQQNPSTATSDPVNTALANTKMSLLEFPEQPLQPGESWDRHVESEVLGGKLLVNTTYTLDPVTSPQATQLTATATEISYNSEFPPDSPISLTVSDAAETLRFDRQSGRLEKKESQLNRVMEIEQAGVQQKMTASMRITIVADRAAEEEAAAEATDAAPVEETDAAEPAESLEADPFDDPAPTDDADSAAEATDAAPAEETDAAEPVESLDADPFDDPAPEDE